MLIQKGGIKRFASIILIFVMIFCGLFLTTNVANADESSGDFAYTVNSDGETVTITGYSADGPKDVVIPSTIAGKTVTVIGKDAFTKWLPSEGDYEGMDITSVTIPGSVKLIDSGAFHSCASLKTVNVEAGVEEIFLAAFRDCTALEVVNLGKGLKKIDRQAFEGCTSLTDITIPDTVSKIRYSAFEDCIKLSNVTLNDGNLYDIEKNTFLNTAITEINIPASVDVIYKNAFPENTKIISNKNLRKYDDGTYRTLVNIKLKAYYNYSKAYEVLDYVNVERTNRGLSKLTMDENLLSYAMTRAVEQGVLFGHTRPSGADCLNIDKTIMGENVAYGRTSAKTTVADWMDSSGHRKNILNEEFKSIGIGVVKINGTYYWTQCFSYVQKPSCTKPSNVTKVTTVQAAPYMILPWFYMKSDTMKVKKQMSTYLGLDNEASLSKVYYSSVNYSSSNKKVATINKYGTITAIKAGRTKITVSLKDYPKIKYSKWITVKK